MDGNGWQWMANTAARLIPGGNKAGGGRGRTPKRVERRNGEDREDRLLLRLGRVGAGIPPRPVRGSVGAESRRRQGMPLGRERESEDSLGRDSSGSGRRRAGVLSGSSPLRWTGENENFQKFQSIKVALL